jgi:transglutaminase-like putative cysteine protease
VTRTGNKDLSRIGAIDYLLMTAGSCLAAYSGGMSILQPSISLFVIAGIVLGAITSYCVRMTLLRSPVIRLDGWLYTCGVACAFAFGAQLQGLMPENGFPVELIAAGWLSWMLIFGSFFTWQDSTLLFQAIPSIAMFGLVGCYDTFRGVTFAFFGFILCLATLFARAHRRSMLRQAADSGFFTRGLAPGTPTPSVETTPGLARRMEEGPWRWIAGPEWALASALAIVLVSILGAPVLKQSMQASGISGFVKLPVPRSVRQRISPPPAMTEDFRGTVSIAQGPNTSLSKEPVFEIRMDAPRYLRATTYDTYRGRGWGSLIRRSQNLLNDDVNAQSLEVVKGYQEIDFEITLRRPMTTLPVPGIVTGWKNSPPVLSQPDGRSVVTSTRVDGPLRGRAAVVDVLPPQSLGLVRNGSVPTPTDAVRDVAPVFAPTTVANGLTPRTLAFVEQTIAGAKTDYEKAERIRRAISQRIVYNLNAEAVPADQDPIDYTLFERPEAYCDVYASSMTMLARAAGIPARYVIGFLPDAQNMDRSGRYVVLESDLHAWSELFFKDYGWVVFDATDGARSVPGGERGQARNNQGLFERPWVRNTLDGLMVALFVAGGALVARSYLRKRRSHTPHADLEAEYLVFSNMLERIGRKRRESSRTPDEFFAEIKPSLGSAASVAEEINRRFVRLMYSNGGATSEDVARMRADLRNLSRMLQKPPQPSPTPPKEASTPK